MRYGLTLSLAARQLALCVTLCLSATTFASAQIAIDPRLVEFLPASGAVTGCQAEVPVAGTSPVPQLNPAVSTPGAAMKAWPRPLRQVRRGGRRAVSNVD
jgi:hypothetical protein